MNNSFYKKIKSITLIMLSVILLITANGVNVSFSDEGVNPSYNNAANHLLNLGYISGDENGQMNLSQLITREQFAKLIVYIADLEDEAEDFKDTSIFPDVSASRWSNGYINAAVDKGYITGRLDGMFHPSDSITYAEVCTSLVKVFGYKSNEVTGTWPNNYVIKAKNIGITDGMNLTNTTNVSTGEVAYMVYNLLNAPSRYNENITYAESKDLYLDCIILENSKTSDLIAEDEVLTDKGTFYVENTGIGLELGEKSRIKIEDETIQGVYENLSTSLKISVEKVSGNYITYSLGNHISSMTLPSKATYYYKGKIQSYESISEILQVNSSIVLEMKDDGKGYSYGVIYDPIYSKPEIAVNFSLADKKLGGIKFDDEIRITRNGVMIGIDGIEEKDTVYQVSDIWEKNKYILVVDNKVEGEITDILPNKISPKSIIVDKTNYELSEDIDLSKISNRGVFQVEDSVTLILGHDGTVVDIVMNGGEDNSHFALVLNHYTETSNSIEDFGNEVHLVNLLHVEGTVKTYKIIDDETNFNGELVRYKIVDSDDEDDYETVELQELEYMNAEGHVIDKYEKKIDENYFADNMKVFNIVHNIYGADSVGYLMSWQDLPDGEISPEKIKYLSKVGPFEDINVMFVENILDEDYRQGIVTETKKSWTPQTGTVYTHTVLINGTEYITNNHVEGMSKDDVVEVKLKDNKILSVENIKYSWVDATKIDAIDSTRIKINDKIYKFSDDVAIYFKNYDGEYTMKGTNDITSDETYGRISVYLDKSTKYGGRVELIIVSE